jgi:hypothetical protein
MHIGSLEGVTLVEFEPVEGEIPQEVQLQEELEEGGQAPDLPECPDHRLSTFLKGKPQSVISLPRFININLCLLMFDALSIGTA